MIDSHLESENRQQVEAELAQPGARELLDLPVLRLAYTGPDGRPRVIPIGFVWRRGQLVVCTATTSPKARALAARPEVAATLDTGETPAEARSLLIRGAADLETVDGVPEEFLMTAAKTLPADQLADYETQVRRTYEQMVRISITPTWARFFDFGRGRLPGFLQDLAAEASGTGR